MSSDDVLVRLRGVSKDYRSLRPLRIAELDLPPGRSLALLGFDQMMAEVLRRSDHRRHPSGQRGSRRLRQADVVHRRSGRLADDARSVWSVHGSRRARRAVHGRTEPGASALGRRRRHVARRARAASPSSRRRSVLANDLRATGGCARTGLSARASVSVARLRSHAKGPRRRASECDALGEDASALATDMSRIVEARGIASIILTADQAFARAVAKEVLVLEPATGALKPASAWRRWFS